MKHTPMICETCAYWRAGDGGRCHRNAPIVTVTSDDTHHHGWPHSDPDDWCGEYRPHGPTHQKFGKEGRND